MPLNLYPLFVRGEVFPADPLSTQLINNITASVGDPTLTVTVSNPTLTVTVAPDSIVVGP